MSLVLRSVAQKCHEPLIRVKDWTQEHPTVMKTIKIGLLIFGIALFGSSLAGLFVFSVSSRVVIERAFTSIVSIALAILLPTQGLNDLSLQEVWQYLAKKTNDHPFNYSNKPNHRFGDILCPEATIVSLEGSYLHANQVGEGFTQTAFVASQAPLCKDHELFWKIVLSKPTTIIDLTTESDQGEESKAKVEPYYPLEENTSKEFGCMRVELIYCFCDQYVYGVTNSQIKKKSNVIRYHFKEWKDHSAVSLDLLKRLVHQIKPCAEKELVWIHCRAGVGRTGTLITAYILNEKIEKGEITQDNLKSSLVHLILGLRKQRGRYFVQNMDQFCLLHDYALSVLQEKINGNVI
jgi:protein tyrosine phosphatase